MEGLPVGVANLDSGQCQLTGDPVYPVLYRNTKEMYCPKCKKKYVGGIGQCPEDDTQLVPMVHKLHATRVVHLVDMPSPNEAMKNVGFCGVSRVIASSFVLLKLAQYKNEKLSDLPQAGLLLLNNILPAQWENITKGHQKDRRKLGQEIWSNIMVLMGLDPERPITADFLNFAQLPDQFNEKEATELYINIVALAFGVDVREFWPMGAGGIGATAAETLIMHQKAKGKGVGDLISTLERAINWHLLPEAVSFAFDFQDDDEDKAKAELDETRTKTILSMYLPTPDGGDMVATRDEVRQMLADNVTYFHDDFLETDTTSQTSADDTEVKAIYGPTVVIDKYGKVRVPRGYRILQAKKGGPGSGHHGHAGRPGERGGSAPGEGGSGTGGGGTEREVPRQKGPGGRAPAGGMIGMNGMYYPGGTFLPSTTLPKMPQGESGRGGRKPRKQQVERYRYEMPPTPTAESILSIVGGVYAGTDQETGLVLSRNEDYVYVRGGQNPTIRSRGKFYGDLNSLIAAYNQGVRWVEPMDESDKPKKTDKAQKQADRVQPPGQPLERWGDKEVEITPEDVALAIIEFNERVPEAAGLLQAGSEG